MVYKNYYLLLILRIILLLINVFITAGAYALVGSRDIFFLPVVLSIVLILQVIDLILFLNRSSKEIERFLENLWQGDLSEKFDAANVGPPFSNLYRAFNNVINQLENVAVEKEAQFAYLKNIMSHIETGIMSVREDGLIVIVNDSAHDLLGISDNSSWLDLAEKHPELTGEIDKIKGRGNRLLEINIKNTQRHLSVNQSSVKILGTEYRIITFQDIRTEIEQKEIEAWHKLIQILRHEIRNSVTPIASMTETILMLLEDQSGNPLKLSELKDQDLADIHSSTRTVHSRSENLYRFVEKYRQLTRVPPPEKSGINVRELIDSLQDLFRKEADQESIQLILEPFGRDIIVEADRSLIEQVLINLVKNSMDALKGANSGQVRISASETKRHIIICIEDNGPGIDPSAVKEIFLPFYTTKDEGMGIGLSLSRQIMNLHGGTLTVDSQPGESTRFSLVFKK
jgi:nitrogen fixation/metabolism regulation signal transduction histidine kinase